MQWDKYNSSPRVSFWHKHKGLGWHVSIVFKPDKVDIYLGTGLEKYPHAHVFSGDSAKLAVWSLSRKTHLDVHVANDPNRQLPLGLGSAAPLILDLLASLPPITTQSGAEFNEVSRKVADLNRKVSSSERYQRSDWDDATSLSRDLNKLRSEYLVSERDYEKSKSELDKVFESLKKLREKATKYREDQDKNYRNIKPEVQGAVAKAKSASTDTRPAFEELKRVQTKLKGTSLAKKERDELWDLLQQGFGIINKKREERKGEQNRNYRNIKPEVQNAVAQAKSATTDTRPAFDELKRIQAKLKGTSLEKKERDELWDLLQQGFGILNKKREDRKWQQVSNGKRYLQEAQSALWEAKSTSDFRSTRQKLMNISKQAREQDLNREDRQAFKSLMDDAFSTLKQRQDVENQQKKREWEARIYETISRKKESRSRLEDSIRRDEESLNYQHNKYSNVRPGRSELEIKRNINAKISEINSRISSKRQKIREINASIIELEYKLRN